MEDLLCPCLSGAGSTFHHVRPSSTFNLVISTVLSQQLETGEMEQKTTLRWGGAHAGEMRDEGG